MRNAWVRTKLTAAAVRAGVAREVGRDELFLTAGLALLGYGLWLTPWAPAAFIVPGGVLVWMALPPRRPFVVGSSASKSEERRG
ncbi:MAG: hypothetical protein AB7R67_21785 [Vicinamibacterales bacterium]